MKKWLSLTLVLLLVLSGCAGTGDDLPAHGQVPAEEPGVETVISPTEETSEVWEHAPELRVTDGANRVDAIKCTTSWDYERPDGTRMAIEACGMGPLQAKQYMEPLVTDSGMAWLEFELDPDSVSVKCWDAKYFGSYDHEVEEEHVEVEVLVADDADGTSTKTYSIPLKEGSWVYKVTAKWTRAEKYGGTGYFGFYTE